MGIFSENILSKLCFESDIVNSEQELLRRIIFEKKNIKNICVYKNWKQIAWYYKNTFY